jgi:hypothetical protein
LFHIFFRVEKEFGCIPGPVNPLGLLLLREEGLVAVLDCLSADPRLLLLSRAGSLLHQYSLPGNRSTGIKPVSLIRPVTLFIFQSFRSGSRMLEKKERSFIFSTQRLNIHVS